MDERERQLHLTDQSTRRDAEEILTGEPYEAWLSDAPSDDNPWRYISRYEHDYDRAYLAYVLAANERRMAPPVIPAYARHYATIRTGYIRGLVKWNA